MTRYQHVGGSHQYTDPEIHDSAIGNIRREGALIRYVQSKDLSPLL